MELPYSLPLPSLRPPAAEQHPPCLWALSSFSASLQNTAYPWAQTSPSLLPVHWKWFETLCWETAPWGAEIGEWRTTKNESSVQQETHISMHNFLTLCQSFLPLANIKVTCAPSLPSSSLLGFPGDRLLTEALQGQLSSFGPEAAKKEDSTIWKYHLLTWNRKSSGTHRLADWLRPSQVTRAGLLNDTHASELCYDWVFFFSAVKAKHSVSLIPDLTLWKMPCVPLRAALTSSFLSGWDGFVPRFSRNLYAALSECSDTEQ